MRFPDLVTEVLSLQRQVESHKADLEFLHSRISHIHRQLNSVSSSPDPTVPRETQPSLLDVIDRLQKEEP